MIRMSFLPECLTDEFPKIGIRLTSGGAAYNQVQCKVNVKANRHAWQVICPCAREQLIRVKIDEMPRPTLAPITRMHQHLFVADGSDWFYVIFIGQCSKCNRILYDTLISAREQP